MIISQIKIAIGMLTLAISAVPTIRNTPGIKWPRATPTAIQKTPRWSGIFRRWTSGRLS